MGRLLNQLVTILLLIAVLYMIMPSRAPAQTIQTLQTRDRVVPVDSDLPFWTDLLADRPCSPDGLAAALRDDRARGHCTVADQDCHRTAASVILRVCAATTDSANLAFCDTTGASRTDRMACRIAALSGTTLPVAALHPLGLFQHEKTEAQRRDGHAAIEARAQAIRTALPARPDLRARTDLSFPDRRRLDRELARIEAIRVAPCPATIPAANIPICEDAEAAQYLDVIARAASAAFAIWEPEASD